ncbi:MAG: Transaldolase [Gemmatimonadetes bacterium]|nr:Transaldolase [Gemmatimonadota bacterium]
MKVLIATADLDEVRWAERSGLLDGVITSPSLLDAGATSDERELLTDICRVSATPVYASVRSLDSEEILQDARVLAKISDQVVVQVPLVEGAIGAIRRLHLEGVRVAATLVFNAAQALLAAKAGARAVITPVDHLDSAGHDGLHIVGELRAAFDASRSECEIIAVRPTSATQFTQCALAGADAAAVEPEVLRRLLTHPLTDRGVHQFLDELSRRPGSWTSA